MKPGGAGAYLLAASAGEEIWASVQLTVIRNDFLCVSPTLP